ncbi:MAG: hypothetical protein KBA81_02795 [Rhabdochlamydiaceae bacterium]|nr:hypothetical protein [Rhabdochlamydiaceae bacterium]
MYSGFVSIIVLALVHLYANKAKVFGWVWHGRFLSFAAGLSFAYVFVDLLPALEKGQPVLKQVFGEAIPYFDRHAYLIALLGLLFYYGIQRKTETQKSGKFWLTISGYLLFNFFVGASLSDSTNPDIQPVTLFTIAIGMHYFVRDHQARKQDSPLFMHRGRWWLVAALFLGYGVGTSVHIPDAVVAIAVSFLAGGVLLNVLHYELPEKKQSGYFSFAAGALLYTLLLITVGEV